MRPELLRPTDRLIAGVCTGLAAHLRLPVNAVRLGFVLTTLMGGLGLAFYAWLWLLVPSAEDAERAKTRTFDPRNVAENFARNVAPWLGSRPGSPAPRGRAAAASPGVGPGTPPAATNPGWARPGVRESIIGLGLLALAVAVALQFWGVQIDWRTWLPLIAIAVGAVLTWMQLDDARNLDSDTKPSFRVFRLIGGIALVALGIVLIIATSAGTDLALQTLLATSAVLIGLGVVLLPWVVKYWRELGSERAARARAFERADIAAHLHDSVLQTLALIQNRAGNEVEVLRLARAQERELREWLYADPDRDTSSLAERLRALGAEVEDSYGHPVEFISVGDTVVTESLEALIQASREAMVNAAKHAGGHISVFLEVKPKSCEVFIRDRGPGFDPDRVPMDRRGVRESLLGRMQRHGGSARIRDTGNGTEVALTMHRVEEAKLSHE